MTAPGGRPSEAIVRLQGVRKSYDGQVLVVKDIDLDIARGEFLTLLGPSGSGKTTILMMLAGFEIPTAGTILLGGKDITRMPPHRRGIGVVFQNYALFPHMTVGQNIAYPLTIQRRPKAEIAERVQRALALVKLQGLEARRPAQLSGGQQQRVALARALVFQPELVLLDEPLGALDKKLREQMQYELKQIHEELGVTMVYVTHDQGEALTMSDRIAVFNEGSIQQLASPGDLYERPVNAFVADFVGENNRLPGRVIARRQDRAQVSLPDGTTVWAIAVGDLAIGGEVILSVRPERVSLHPQTGAENIFSAPIEKCVYLGDSARILLRFGGQAEFALKTAQRGSLEFQRGDRIGFGWWASDCVAFVV